MEICQEAPETFPMVVKTAIRGELPLLFLSDLESDEMLGAGATLEQ